jgi:FkbM family methyltransferase
VKRYVKAAAGRLGYEIARADQRSTMASAIARFVGRHPARTVIDVGASDGRWSRMVAAHLPAASFLLFEAQAAAHAAPLHELEAADARFHVVLAAAGDREGTIHFDATDAWSGVASHEPTGDHDIVVPMTTVDAEVERRGLPGPYLLKLDTHGFEVPILEGATRTLGEAAVVVIEAYNFELRPGALRFHELCTYLADRGLRVVDLVDVMRRPSDDALWQFDLFFLPQDQPEFASARYA